MAVITLDEGGTTFAPTGWSDNTGLVDDATAVIESGEQPIVSALDQTGIQTDGIFYLHVRAGFTGTIGSPTAGAFTSKFHSTYTAGPNVILDGGTLYLAVSGTCAWVLVLSGTLVLVSGTVTLLEKRGGTVYRAGAAVTTTIDSQGGYWQDTGDNSNAVTTAHFSESTGDMRGAITTLNTYRGSRVTAYAATATVNMYGGRLNLIKGGATTINGRAGVLDTTKANLAQTITTLNRWPHFIHNSPGAAALTTVTTTVDKVGGPISLTTGQTVGLP